MNERAGEKDDEAAERREWRVATSSSFQTRDRGYRSVKLFVIRGFSANPQVKLEVQRCPSSPTACFCRTVPNAVERTKMPELPYTLRPQRVRKRLILKGRKTRENARTRRVRIKLIKRPELNREFRRRLMVRMLTPQEIWRLR